MSRLERLPAVSLSSQKKNFSFLPNGILKREKLMMARTTPCNANNQAIYLKHNYPDA